MKEHFSNKIVLDKEIKIAEPKELKKTLHHVGVIIVV